MTRPEIDLVNEQGPEIPSRKSGGSIAARLTSPRCALALAAAVAALVACAGPSDAPTRGEALYDACASCHRDDGSGDPAVGAPPIAGLSTWYLEAQLQKFRNGQRGAHFDDAAGMRMRPMAMALREEADLKAVIAYVAALPPPPKGEVLATQGANLDNGKNLFLTCTACHGVDGSGNQALNAPPIAGAPDWYVLEQLKKFKSGARGAVPGDVSGSTMAAIAKTLVDESAMKDVAAYASSLDKKAGK